MSIILLIADDQRLFRQSLRLLLEHERDLTVIAEARDYHEAFDLSMQHKPDLVLIDLDTHSLDGVTATKLIRGCLPSTKVLVLSLHDEDSRIVAAIEAGAFGYILKDADRADLLRTIRAAHRGEHVPLRFMPDRFTRHTLEAVGQARSAEHTLIAGLTDREREILACAATGWSNKEIADHLCVSIDTVKTHLHHIYHKLSVHGRVEAVLAYLQMK